LDGIARCVYALRLVSVALQHHRKRIGRVDVVVDDQHALRGAAQPFAARLVRSGSLDARQTDLERRAFAEALPASHHLPAMHLDQPLHHGQADPQAALRTIQRPISLYEQLEYPGQKLLRQAYPIIADLDDRLLVLGPALDADVSTAIGVLGGV